MKLENTGANKKYTAEELMKEVRKKMGTRTDEELADALRLLHYAEMVSEEELRKVIDDDLSFYLYNEVDIDLDCDEIFDEDDDDDFE